MKTPSIRRHVFLPVAVGLVILTASIAASFRWYQTHHLHQAVADRLETVAKASRNQLDNDAEVISGLIDLLETDGRLRQAYLAGDRDRLLRVAAPILEELRSQHRVTHFYFHDPKRVCFLRVHEPQRHGDVIQRLTMRKAAATGNASHGIELGPLGTFTLRVVHPWKVDNQLIGYIELGEDIKHILPQIKDLARVELIVTIDKANLDRLKWEAGMRLMGRKPAWERFKNFVVVDTTLPHIPAGLAALLCIPHAEHSGHVLGAAVGGTQYRGGLLPLIDAGGRDVGDLTTLLDVTEDVRALNKALLAVVVTVLVFAGLVSRLFWVYLGRVEQSLAVTTEALSNRNEWLGTVVNASADGIIAIDEQGTITLFNPAAGRIFGWKAEDMIGQPVERLMPEELRQQHTQYLRGYFTTGMPRAAVGRTIELVGVRSEGQRFPMELSLSVGHPSGKRFALAMIRDVTDRKQHEEELCRAKEYAEETAARLRRLSRAVEQSPASIVITDPQGSIEYVNPGFVRNTGYTADEALGKNPRVLKSGLHPLEFYEQMWKTLARGEVWRDEICNKKKSEELFWEDATIAPVLNEHGAVTHFVAVKVDITARKRAEAELKEALEQLQRTTSLQQAILNSAEYSIIAAQADGTITLFNAGAERMLGYRAEDVVGKVTPQIFHDEQEVSARARALTTELGFPVQPGFEAFVAKTRLCQPNESQWTYVRKDGTRFPSLLSVTPICDNGGNLTGFMGIAQDITERKRAEEALQASETRYRLLAENMRDVVWTADLNLHRTYVSSSITQLTGHTVEEALQLTFDEVLTADSAKQTINAFMEIMARAKDNPKVFSQPVCLEMEYRCKNGGTVWAEANMSFLLGKDGFPVGGMGVSRNITARKKAAQELHEYAQKLARANRELEEAGAAAQAASKAKGQFLANMSHELRTPLNGVIGMTELLRDTPLDDRQRGFVAACHSSGRVLLALISGILDFSKIEAGKLELDEREFDLGQMVKETMEAMAIQARQKGLQLLSHVAPQLQRTVHGDDVRLRQVLLNLIGNAIKFTETGEVAVKVEPAEPQAGKPAIRFEVADTGIGIPPDRSDRLFQPFSQADSSTTRKYGGTGLGLVISKNLVELMGGQIGAISQPGHGSTFWCVVPLAPTGSERPEENNSSGATVVRRQTCDTLLKGRRVLLAEDNRVNCMYAQEVLRQGGMECRAVENGLQSLQAVQSERFDLVLMDCQMPEMDGFEATRRIRAMESNGQLAGHLPVIALTANAIKGDRELCLAAGMDNYIGKPFEPNALLEMMRHVLAAQEQKPTAEPPAELSRAPSPEDSPPPIDHSALLARCMGNLEFAQSLLADFQGDLPERIDEIAERVHQGDARAMAESAHALKGAAGTITAESLRALAAAMEAAGKAGDPTPLASLADQLCAEAQRCLRYIPELQQRMNAS
jgi:PAS domain S-box-containing protein